MYRILIAFSTVFTFAFTYPANSESPEAGTRPVLDAESETRLQESVFEMHVKGIYNHAQLNEAGLNYDIFRRALIGYYNMKHNSMLATEKPVLSVVDFNISSTDNRFWIIDLKSKRLLYKTLVAHGRGSGYIEPKVFSNIPNSFTSSVGFYITGETYFGKHGLSLKLRGQDEGFNTNAEDRAIVIHGADYVSHDFVAKHGFLGRSHGCPALPNELSTPIINLIKDNTLLYIDGPVANYNSSFLNQSLAIRNFSTDLNIAQRMQQPEETQASL